MSCKDESSGSLCNVQTPIHELGTQLIDILNGVKQNITAHNSMTPRLAHTKSRNGCFRCKARKVKCDETRPQCQNCSRQNVECQFPKHSQRTTSSKSPVKELTLEACLTADERRHLEQQLLHYFSSSIVWTLGSSHNSTGREV